jgi:hypothetical protein
VAGTFPFFFGEVDSTSYSLWSFDGEVVSTLKKSTYSVVHPREGVGDEQQAPEQGGCSVRFNTWNVEVNTPT